MLTAVVANMTLISTRRWSFLYVHHLNHKKYTDKNVTNFNKQKFLFKTFICFVNFEHTN